jgi:methylglutaconyl-CoA hydratase
MSPPTTLQMVRRSAHVAEVWLNRPDVRNAFNDAVIAELAAAFASLSADPALRCVVLGGRGKVFCAGADLAWMRAMAGYGWEQNQADAVRLADMLWAIRSCPVPVIARIHGDCYAGGVGLAAACDMRVAAAGAGFCLSEARIGLLPATIGPYVLRALGEAALRRYIVTAERFDAATAHRLGFVHEVAGDDELDAAVDALVGAVTANGPAAVRACKQLVADLDARPLTESLRAETARRIADIRASDEAREGVGAFLARRTPSWLDGA